MPASRVTIRLSPATKVEAEKYAAQFGMAPSELAKLLLIRENVRKDLAKRCVSRELTAPFRRQKWKGAPLPTVTAQLPSKKWISDFDTYAQGIGLSRNRAAALLFETELRDHWLERVLPL